MLVGRFPKLVTVVFNFVVYFCMQYIIKSLPFSNSLWFPCLQVLEREKIMQTFQDITSKLEQALAGISFDELGISDEVREQVNHLDS